MRMSAALDAIRAGIGARHGFAHSVGTLVGGTAIAQGLAVLALPILTRMYTPEDFSVLAIYASILGIASVVACMRLEIAIPMPERDQDAANLLALALASSATVALFGAIVVWALSGRIVELFGQPTIRQFLWLIPLGIWLASSYSAVQYWSTRKKKFRRIATTRVVQSLGGVGTQVGLGAAGIAPFGLILGHMISTGAGLVRLGRNAWREDRSALATIDLQGMQCMLREYKRFPKYSTFEAFANNAGTQLPIVIIAALAIGPEAGFLMLATRVMAAPMALIGGAVSQVYLSRASSELREGKLGTFTADSIGGLAKTGVGPLIFAGVMAPLVFPVLFGAGWGRAGEMIAWMTPWFVLQFLSSPISMALHVTGNQRAALVLQVFGAVLRIGVVLLAGKYFAEFLVESYAVVSFIFYAVYFLVVISVVGVPPRQLYKKFLGAVPIIAAWAAVAASTRLIF